MKRFNAIKAQAAGFTLIEIIVTLVIVGIAATALMSVFANLVRSSADPAIQQQAISVAEAYIEEIASKAYADPDGIETGESRASFDDVDDYHNLTGAPADQAGVAIAALAGFTVTVTVENNLATRLNGIDAWQIDVRVAHPAIDDILLSTYRTDY